MGGFNPRKAEEVASLAQAVSGAPDITAAISLMNDAAAAAQQRVDQRARSWPFFLRWLLRIPFFDRWA